jgi:uncharacterized membrane protein YvlD (DUF360 family)
MKEMGGRIPRGELRYSPITLCNSVILAVRRAVRPVLCCLPVPVVCVLCGFSRAFLVVRLGRVKGVSEEELIAG